MSSPKNLALAVLSVVAIGAGVLAWRQQRELQSLRAAAAQGADREQLNRRAVAAEQRARELADELAAAQAKLNEAKATVAKAETPKRAEDATGAGPNIRTMMNSAANIMNRPEMQRMMALSQKAALDASYARLFKQLGLAPEKLEQFKKLMVERQTVASDVFGAAVQQGLDPMQNRREIAKLTADGQAKVDGEIKSLLGEADYASYQNYQTTLPQRGVVNQLQQSLSYTPNPLSESQAEQLVQILAQNPVARPAAAAGQGVATTTRTMVFTAGGSGGAGGDLVAPTVVSSGPMGLGVAPISEAAVAASRSVLTDPQVEVLQQMQQQQTQMRTIMQSMGGQSGQGGTGIIQIHSTTSGGTPPPSPASGEKPPGGE